MNANLRSTLDELITRALDEQPPTRDQSFALLGSGDDDLLDVVAAAARVRRHFFGNRVKLNTIINMKSGLCPEDCNYCSQRSGSQADVLKYNWVDQLEATAIADQAVASGAKRVCLVASGRGPTDRDIGRVVETVAAIKRRHPNVEVCTSLGLLTAERAERLFEAGVYAYNHNLNTSESNYLAICSTHLRQSRRDGGHLSGSGTIAVFGGHLRDG